MKLVLMLGSCAFFALQIGTAAAGVCTTEIENVSKMLASRDAGSGPTGATAGASGQPPTAAMTRADPSTTASTAAAKSNQPQHPPTAAMNSAATGLATKEPAGTTREEHPPTAAMNRATQGSAASPQDVQRQTSGQPTAAQQAQGASAGKSSDNTAASTALEQARGFDQAGQETRCMESVQQAKRLLGS
jgi:hypothetical protein